MRLTLVIFAIFFLSCSADRFLVQEKNANDDPEIFLSWTEHEIRLNKEITGRLSKESNVGFFKSDSSYYSPFELSKIELNSGYYTIQLNSLLNSGFKSPFMFPLIKVYNNKNEEIEVVIIKNQIKGSTWHLPPHINTFWKIKNDKDQILKIVVYADRTPIEGDYKTTTLFINPTLPLIIPFQKKVIKVPFGKYKLKIVGFKPEHHKENKSRL